MGRLKISDPFWQVVGLGTLAGMRSSSAPAITSQILSHHHSIRLQRSNLKFMQSKTVANTLTLLSLGEVVADKIPSIPNRIAPASVSFRGLSGALAGASIYKARGGNAVVGAMIGASAAVASSFISFYLRRGVVKRTKIIDPLIGAIEDALVAGAGIGLIQLS